LAKSLCYNLGPGFIADFPAWFPTYRRTRWGHPPRRASMRQLICVRLIVTVTVAMSCMLSRPYSAAGQDLPVTNGMLLWLDATDPATLFQDDSFTTLAEAGDPVGGWLDKSGNEYHATQSDTNKQPSYDATAMNGRPAVRFEGPAAHGMIISDDLVLTRPYTAFIVNQYWGASHGRTLQSRDLNWLLGMWAGNASHYAEGWVSVNRLADQDVVYVADALGDVGGDSAFFVNGIDRTALGTPSAAPGRLGLVSEGVFPGEVSDADISEVLIYDRLLDTTELTSVRNYLYTKYDVTLLEPEAPPAPQNTVLKGEVGVFTGGDPGEGLDLQGSFVAAVDVGGFGGVQVGDAEFTDGSEVGIDDSPGVSITDANEIPDWHLPDYGDSGNDDELELVMQGIRWNVPPGVNVDVEVEPGQYQLQLLFAESCCDRGFDIFVESDELSVDNFNVQVLQEGINNSTQGVYFRQTVNVSDGELNILLGGINPLAPDNNPILNAFTLELLGPPGTPGDFNGDGNLDAADINDLTLHVRSQEDVLTYDVDGDGLLNESDRETWVNELKNTYFGDANLDGEFNSGDLVQVLAAGEYSDTVEDNSLWEEGDWSGDGDFDSTDLVVAFAAGGYEVGPRQAVASVPEPAGWLLAVTAAAGIWGRWRPRGGRMSPLD
jgi:hypothetical protein